MVEMAEISIVMAATSISFPILVVIAIVAIMNRSAVISAFGCNGHSCLNALNSCNEILHFSIGSSSCIDYNWI